MQLAQSPTSDLFCTQCIYTQPGQGSGSIQRLGYGELERSLDMSDEAFYTLTALRMEPEAILCPPWAGGCRPFDLF
ncbi:hypothetical protein EYZ11_005550 [Aspergillus tanneri]|uniref:Uncharacterized protein n=1 Tax=Aspergillus tanneri TaxID=1220188 RepID=A0A4S3JHM0_9EURO|nr:hypothetical protein EYZ11_005550 [Aspergillus tanneri]